jgi:tetratricopeptide (TPR) repeat protein
MEDFTPEQILAGLGDRLKLLQNDLRYLPPRQRTLRGAIDWSYHLLTVGERTLFRRLGVFVGGCSLAAIKAVCNANPDLPIEAQEGITALSSKSLLYRETGVDGEPRWRMLESIREYALRQLGDAGEAETLRAHHAAFFAGYLEERFDRLFSREQDRMVQEINADIGNVRAAWDWALAMRQQDLIRRSIQGLIMYYETQSGFAEGEALCAQALATLTEDLHRDRILLAQLRSYHGHFLGQMGRLGVARAELERGCAELRQAGMQTESAHPFIMLGTVAWQQGDYTKARAVLEESLRISRTIGNTFCTALSLFFLGLVAHASDDYDQADEFFREALHLARLNGQPGLISVISVFSSPTLLVLGQYIEARERLQAGLDLARGSQVRWLVGVAQGHLGLILNAQGDHMGARTASLEAITLAQESGNPWNRAWAEVSLGDAELGLGNSMQASTHYCLGLQLATEEHALPIALDALAGLATLQAQAGERKSALELAGQVLFHPASSGNARTRVDQVRRMLNADFQNQSIEVTGTFEETVQRILADAS